MARPKIPIRDRDIEQIEVMAGLGMKLDHIALVLGISASTLKRWLKQNHVLNSYKKGRAVSELTIARTLFELAKGGNLAAIIWWEKTRLGRSDRAPVGRNKAAPSGTADSDALALGLSDEELIRQINAIQERARRRQQQEAEQKAREN